MSMLLSWAMALICLIAVIAAIAIVIHSPREPVRRFLAFFLMFAVTWVVLVNVQSVTASAEYNLVIVRLCFVAVIFMSYALLRFAYAVAGSTLSRLGHIIVLTFVVASSALMLTPMVIYDVTVTATAVVPHRLALYYVIVLSILAVNLAGIVRLVRSRMQTRNALQKTRLGIVIFGLSQGVVFASLTNVILPNIVGSTAPSRYAWIPILLWTVILVYAVVRHRFLDLRLAFVRSVAYTLLLTTLVGIYFVVAWLLTSIMRETLTNEFITAANIFIAIILAAALQPIKHFFDRLTNNIFYRDNYSTDDFYAKFSEQLSITTDLRSLLKRAADTITDTLKSEQGFFFIRYGEARYMNAGTYRHKRLLQAEVELIDEYVAGHTGGVLLANTLPANNPIFRLLTKHKVAVVLPLEYAGKIIGYFFLGDKRSRDYTRRDMKTLETVSDELIIATQNALAVQEIKELNATLQERIDAATSELRRSNISLQKLDATKDEFVSMASHQLRTPLTSVKGYISMVLEGDAGKISPMQKQLLTEAFTSSERMVHLIGDFLNVSRLQTGKFMVDRHQLDLAKLVSQEVDSLQTTAGAHDLKLQYRVPAYFPVLYLDEGKMRQVVMNFIDNAIYYSREHTTITVSLRSEDGQAILRVKDTGIGVPKTEQAGLFTKFFRATNARRQRPDGTGVGLFLAKKIIVAHEGDIIFESIEGEGSTFGFRLPIKKLSLAPADDADQLNQ